MAPSQANCLKELNSGGIVIIKDDVAQNPRSFLCSSASLSSEKQMARLIDLAGGIVCVAITEARALELELPSMNPLQKNSQFDFTTSVEAREGITTGISAADRAKTCREVASSKKPRLDIVTPGHIFPVKCSNGGVLVRSAVPEAAVDLMRLADAGEAAVFCHLLNEKAEFAEPTQVEELSRSENIPIIGITEILERMMTKGGIIEPIAEASLPLHEHPYFRAIAFKSRLDGTEHLVLAKGEFDLKGGKEISETVTVRVQAENRLGDLFGPSNQSSRKIINDALSSISDSPLGLFVYIRHRRKRLLQRQIKMIAKDCYNDSSEPVENGKVSQLREIGIGAEILRLLGVRKIRLLSNKKPNLATLSAFNLELDELVAIGGDS